jgi:hypothetical protein
VFVLLSVLKVAKILKNLVEELVEQLPKPVAIKSILFLIQVLIKLLKSVLVVETLLLEV